VQKAVIDRVHQMETAPMRRETSPAL